MPTRFDSLVTRLSPSVPGCPQPVIEQYVRDSAIDACEKTLAYRHIQNKIPLTNGVYDYPYDPPTNTEVHAFLSATVDGARMRTLSLEEFQDRFPKWPDSAPADYGVPTHISQLDADTFIVGPTPDAAKTYEIRMIIAVKPLRTSVEMDTTAFDELENIIMHGALQNLLILPERTWSDRELAAYHAKQFLHKTAERRARANLGAARNSLRVKPVAFG
jgi:hypothetical protein